MNLEIPPPLPRSFLYIPLFLSTFPLIFSVQMATFLYILIDFLPPE